MSGDHGYPADHYRTVAALAIAGMLADHDDDVDDWVRDLRAVHSVLEGGRPPAQWAKYLDQHGHRVTVETGALSAAVADSVPPTMPDPDTLPQIVMPDDGGPLVLGPIPAPGLLVHAADSRHVRVEVVAGGGLLAETPPTPETVAELDQFPPDRVLRFAASILRSDHAGLLSGTVVPDDDAQDRADAADMARALGDRLDGMADGEGTDHLRQQIKEFRRGWRCARAAISRGDINPITDERTTRAARDLHNLISETSARGIQVDAVGLLADLRKILATLEGPDHA